MAMMPPASKVTPNNIKAKPLGKTTARSSRRPEAGEAGGAGGSGTGRARSLPESLRGIGFEFFAAREHEATPAEFKRKPGSRTHHGIPAAEARSWDERSEVSQTTRKPTS